MIDYIKRNWLLIIGVIIFTALILAFATGCSATANDPPKVTYTTTTVVVSVPVLPAPTTEVPETFTTPPAYTSPSQMAAILKPGMTLKDCNAPERDFSGAMYVQCSTQTEELVRMSTWENPALDNTESLKQLGWFVEGSDGWSIATSISVETLDEASTLLTMAREGH